VKQDDTQVPTETNQNHPSNLYEAIIRPDSPSLEDAVPESTRSRQPTLRDILTPVPVFDGYIIPLSQFIYIYFFKYRTQIF